MAGNDHPDFSEPVMVGCIMGLADAENHLDSILGKLEPFCTAGTLGAGATNFRRRSPVRAPGRGIGRPILRCATAATYPHSRTNWRATTNFRRFGSPWLQHSPHRVWARDEKRSPRLDFGR